MGSYITKNAWGPSPGPHGGSDRTIGRVFFTLEVIVRVSNFYAAVVVRG